MSILLFHARPSCTYFAVMYNTCRSSYKSFHQFIAGSNSNRGWSCHIRQARPFTSRNGRKNRKSRRNDTASSVNTGKSSTGTLPPPAHIRTPTLPKSTETNFDAISNSSHVTTRSVDVTYTNLSTWLSRFKEKWKNKDQPLWKIVLLKLVPKRYRFPQGKCPQMYSYEQGILIAKRLAMWTALVLLLVVGDETSPFELVGVRGPSMIPTMAADGSDLWLCRTYPSWLRQCYDSITNSFVLWCIVPRLRHGTIVGFAHPDSPNSAVAMKRIVGLPGDRIQRYGQYVHLYTEQDPVGLGVTWPITSDPNHTWILSRGTAWDTEITKNPSKTNDDMLRTIVVPDGHVWVEADCPALGLDSRQFGPIPISWIRTRVIAKMWPLQQMKPTQRKWSHRPHPIPLDVETLMEYNVFHHITSDKPST
jgi:signal peptidase I